MHLEHLVYLISIHQTASTQKTADALHTSPQNVSKILHQIENFFGFSLFERTSKGTYLTEQGLAVLKFATNTLQQVEVLQSRYQENEDSTLSGKLNLYTCPLSNICYLNQLLPQFTAQYPNIIINTHEVDMLDCYPQMIKECGHICFVPLQIFDTVQDNFTTIPLCNDKLMVLTSQNSPLAKQKSISLSKLKKQNLLIYTKSSAEKTGIVALFPQGFHPLYPPFHIANYIGYIDYIRSGRFVSIASQMSIKRTEAYKEFIALPLRDEQSMITHCMVINGTLTSTEKLFFDFVKNYFNIV